MNIAGIPLRYSPYFWKQKTNMNGLKTIYARFSDISMGDTLEDGVDLGDVTSALGKVGISALDENGKMRDVGNIMEDLMGVWEQMDQTQKAAIATTLAGKYQLARFEALMNRSDLYKQYKQSAEEGKEKGTLDLMNEKYVDSLEGRINKLQASVEGLFTNLFDTSDFSGLIDGLTTAVNLVGDLVDNLGSTSNLLTGIGSLGMKVFGNQIGRGITNFISNRRGEQQEKENAAEKQRVLTQIGANPEGNGLTPHQQAIIDFSSKTLGQRGVMSEDQLKEQQALTQDLIGNYTAMVEQTAKVESNIEATNIALKVLAGTDEDYIKKNKDGSYDYSDYEEAINKVEGFADFDLAEFRKNGGQDVLNGVIDLHTQVVDLQNLNSEYNKFAEGSKEQYAIAEKTEKKYTELCNTVRDLAKAGQLPQQVMKDILGITDDIEEALLDDSSSTQDFAKSLDALEEKAKNVHDATRALVQTDGSLYNEKNGGIKALANDINKKSNLEATQDKLNQRASGFSDLLDDQNFTTRVSNMIAALGSLTFAIQTVQNLGSIWNNDDLTIGEKILETIMNVSMALPMAASGIIDTGKGFQAIGEKWVEVAKARMALAEAEKVGAAATVASTAAAEGATVATGAATTAIAAEGAAAGTAATATAALGASMAAVAAPILAIAAVIGGVTFGIYKLVEAYNADSTAAENAANASSKIADAVQQSNSEFDTYKSNIDAYKEARSALGDLTKGTDEYNKKLKESNEHLMEALDLYPQLAKYVTMDKDGSLYLQDSKADEFAKEQEKAISNQEAAASISAAVAKQKEQTSYETNTRRQITYQEAVDVGNGQSGVVPLSLSQQDLQKMFDLIKTEGAESVFDENKISAALNADVSDPIVQAVKDSGDKIVTAYNKRGDIEKAAELQRQQALLDYAKSNGTLDGFTGDATAVAQHLAGTNATGEDSAAYQNSLSSYQSKSTAEMAAEYANAMGLSYQNSDFSLDGKGKQAHFLNAEGEEVSFDRNTMETFLAASQTMADAANRWDSVANSLNNISNSKFSDYLGNDTVDTLESWTPGGEIDLSGISSDQYNSLKERVQNTRQTISGKEIDDLGIDDQWAKDKGFESAESFTQSFFNGLREAFQKEDNFNALMSDDSFDGLSNMEIPEEYQQKILALCDNMDKLNDAYDKGKLSQSNYTDGLLRLSSKYDGLEEQTDDIKSAQEEYTKALSTKDTNAMASASDKLAKAQAKLKGAIALKEWVKAKQNTLDYLDALESTEAGTQEHIDALTGLTGVLENVMGIDLSGWSNAEREAFFSNTQNIDDMRAALDGDYDAFMRLKVAASEEIVTKLRADAELYTDDFWAAIAGIQQYAMSGEFAELEAGASLNDAPFMATLANIISSMIQAGQDVEGIMDALSAMGIEADVTYDKVPGIQYDQPSDEGAIGGLAHSVETTIEVPRVNFKKTGPSVESYGNAFGGGSGGGGSVGGGGSGGSGGGGGGGSGGGGGGGSDDNFDDSQKDYLEDELDLYERVNTELSKMEKHLDGLDQEYDRLIGYNKANNMNQQINDYMRLIDLAKQKLEIQKQEASDLQGKLSGYGVQFNGEGIITNYAQIFNQLKDQYNSLVDQYNASTDKAYKETLSDQMDTAQKSFDKFKDYIDRYDTLVGDEIKSSLNQIEEYYDEIEDMRIQAFNDAMDAIDTIQDLNDTMSELKGLWTGLSSDSPFRKMVEDSSKLEDYFNLAAGAADKYYDTIINDYKKAAEQATDDTTKNFALQQAAFWQARKTNAANEVGTQNGTGLLDMRLDDLEAVLKYFNGTDEDRKNSIWGENEAAALEALETAYKNLAQAELDAAAQAESLLQDIIDAYEEIGDEFDKMADAYENLTDTIDHYSNMVESLYGEEDYDRLLALMETKQNTLLQNIRFQQNQVQYWEQELAKYDKETEREKWEEVHSQLVDAQQDLNDLAESAAENLADIYSTQTDKFLSDWKNKLLGGDADFAEMQWELSKKNAELYLDDVERAYNIEKLRAKYQQMLNNTTDPSIQRQIADAMNEQVSALQERVKLSQYDVDYANAQLEILQKRIALEEAQRNKSQMKLKRDAQGNYSYVYTANKDNVDNAQSDLLDSEQNAYELTKNNAISLQENYFSALNDYAEKARQIREKNKGDEATMKEQLQALWDSYKEYLTGLAQQLGVTQADMIESVRQMSEDSQGELSDYYTNIADAMNTNWAEAMDNIGISTSTTVISQLQDLTSLEQATNDLMNNFNRSAAEYGDYVNKIEQDTQTSYGNVGDLIDGVIDKQKSLTDATEDFWNLVRQDTDQINKNNAALISYREEIEKLQDSTSKANQAMREAQQLASAKEQEARDWESKYTELKTAVDNGSYFNKGGSGSGGGSVSSEEAAFGIAQNIWTYGSWANDPVRRDRIISRYGEDVANRAQEIVNDYYYSGRAGELYNTDSWAWGYDTGGYTGTWSDKTDEAKNGKLAYLHQKELVLNESDTQNILDAVSLVREFTKQLKSNSLGSLFDSWMGSYSKKDNEQTLKQDVHITAEFPNVNSATEIETALESLNQRAYQYVQKYR